MPQVVQVGVEGRIEFANSPYQVRDEIIKGISPDKVQEIFDSAIDKLLVGNRFVGNPKDKEQERKDNLGIIMDNAKQFGASGLTTEEAALILSGRQELWRAMSDRFPRTDDTTRDIQLILIGDTLDRARHDKMAARELMLLAANKELAVAIASPQLLAVEDLMYQARTGRKMDRASTVDNTRRHQLAAIVKKLTEEAASSPPDTMRPTT